jgi:hypothetical protein
MAEIRVSREFQRLCDRFVEILEATEHSIEEGPVCFVTRTVEIDAEILGRPTHSPLVNYQLFSFESLDASGRALCLGETALHQNQANRLIRNLQDRGITVTALHNHWLNESPRLMYIHWESVENPIDFARKTIESIDFLGPAEEEDEEEVIVSRRFRRLCEQFAEILGGEHEIEEGPVCFVSRPREIDEEILGRRTNSPLVHHQLFSFESLDESGLALCLGETAASQNQANRLIRRLQERGIKVTALHNHWLNESPRLMYIHWESIDNPIDFARKTKESIAFLG